MRMPAMSPRDRLLFAAFVVFAAADIALFTLAGAINQDEGFYLLAGQRVYHGDVLYRDFPYFQAPLAPYVYGVPQVIFGSSLYVGRATAAALFFVTLALTAYAGARLGGRNTALVAVAMMLATPLFMLHMLQARSEAIGTPFVVLSAVLALRLAPGWRLLLLPALAMLAASLVRGNLLPVVALVFAWCAWRTGGDRWMTAAAIIVAVTVAAWSPFLAADVDATVFNVVTAQNERRIQFSAAGVGLPSGSPKDRYIDRMNEISTSWASYLHLLAPAIAGLAFASARLRDRAKWTAARNDVDASAAIAALIALAFFVWLPNVMLYRQEPRYIVPAVPLLALAAALFVRRGVAGVSDAATSQHRAVLAIAVACVLPLAVAIGIASIDLNEPDVVATNRFASLIDKHAPGPGNVVTLDPTIPVAADVPLPRELTMGLFSYWPFLSDADLDRYHVVNRARLEAMMLAPDTKAIVFSGLMAFMVTSSSAPSDLDEDAGEEPFRVFPRLRDTYEIAETNRARLGQGSDGYWLLVRKK